MVGPMNTNFFNGSHLWDTFGVGLLGGAVLAVLCSCDAPTVSPATEARICDVVVTSQLEAHRVHFTALAPMFLLPPDLHGDADHCRAVHGGPGSGAKTAAGRMVAECARAAGVSPGAQYAVAHHLAERHGLPMPDMLDDADGCTSIYFAAMREALGRAIDDG